MRKWFAHVLDFLLDRPACYRAVYTNGTTTYRMCRSYAKELTKIFGGYLQYDPPEFEDRRESI